MEFVIVKLRVSVIVVLIVVLMSLGLRGDFRVFQRDTVVSSWLKVSPVSDEAAVDVVSEVRVDEWCPLRERLSDVGNCIQDVVLDIDDLRKLAEPLLSGPAALSRIRGRSIQ